MKSFRPIFLLVMLAAVIVLSALTSTPPKPPADSFKINGTMPPLVKKAVYLPPGKAGALSPDQQSKDPATVYLIGRHNSNDTIRVALVLQPRDKDKLEELIARQRDKSDRGLFNTRISTQEFIDTWAPPEDQYNLAKLFLTARGFTIDTRSEQPNRLIIVATAPSKIVEQAFQVKLNDYEWQGKRYVSTDRDPSLPMNLQKAVGQIVGLNNFWHMRRQSTPAVEIALADPHGVPTQPLSLPAFGPREIASAYSFPNSNRSGWGTTYGGTGYNLAICTAFKYDFTAVKEYWNQFGVNPTRHIEDVFAGGIPNKTDTETTLDLEQSSSQAPDANILMYMGVDNGFGLLMALDQCAVDNRADAVSFSWGQSEDAYGTSVMNAFHVIFMEMAVQGMPIFCASGDSGAYEDKDAGTREKTVCYPASDPLVTAVGGTSLHLNIFNRRSSESAWTGSGGGVSKYWSRPAWQSGPNVPQNAWRNSADVALDGDPQTGYLMRYQGKWYKGGGTSFAAPNWAALWVLAEQACHRRLGCATQYLYRLSQNAGDYNQDFFDILDGNNGDNRGPGYDAGPGYDYPTGLGAPNGEQLILWLQADCK